jgi:RHS repeat-associated protein
MGEYTGDYNELVYLRARYYAPEMGRFFTKDTWSGQAKIPLSLNRWMYVKGNPVNNTDPSGHNPICQTGCNWPQHNGWAEKAQQYGDKTGGYMVTYAIAAIGVQNPNIQRWYLPKALGGSCWGVFENTHLGLAKVSDNEMNTNYGSEINDGGFRGYGLGMAGQDQTDPKVAVQAMINRIQIVDQTCDGKCTSTDHFIIAALAQNGGNFTKDDLDDLMHGAIYKPRPTGPSHSLNWENFLWNVKGSVQGMEKQKFYQVKLIGPFAANVLYLQGQGWDVPSGIDWQYVCKIYMLPPAQEVP